MAMTSRRAGPLTMAVLERAAAAHLARYASSSENLRRLLMHRVAKAAGEDDAAAAAGRALVEALIARFLRAGLLDDGGYAQAKAARLSRGGASRFKIRGWLTQKGVSRAEVDHAIAVLEERGEGSELTAACAFLRRRRLGPYRSPDHRVSFRQKDLAALTRAGFALDLARKLLGAADVAALEAMARGDEI
jgi:regulatory protein